mgnify:CR=1 FL=1
MRAASSSLRDGARPSEPRNGLVSVRVSSQTLTAEELAAIEAVGQRLRSELARLVKWLPQDSRSVRTMASFLAVDRNTCQRVIAAVQPATGGSEAFCRLPGSKSLLELVKRVKAKGAPRELVAALSVAIDRLNETLAEFDESHARIRARLEATIAIGAFQSDRGEIDRRRTLFEENARLFMRQMRVHSLITAVGPHAGEPAKVEQAWIRGLIGLRLEKGAQPLPLGIASTDRAEAKNGPVATFNPLEKRTEPGQRASGLVEQFCSSPMPTLTTRGPEGSQVTVLDPSLANEGVSVDAAVATRISHVAHPRAKSPEIFHTSAVMLSPTAKFVFDVYLHRSLAIESVPACGAFQYTMAFSEDIEENWPFRLPGQYRLELLGPGLTNAGNAAWARHGDAAAYLFAQTGWPATEYVGHRLEIDYPLWGGTMYQWFDFRKQAGLV